MRNVQDRIGRLMPLSFVTTLQDDSKDSSNITSHCDAMCWVFWGPSGQFGACSNESGQLRRAAFGGSSTMCSRLLGSHSAQSLCGSPKISSGVISCAFKRASPCYFETRITFKLLLCTSGVVGTTRYSEQNHNPKEKNSN